MKLCLKQLLAATLIAVVSLAFIPALALAAAPVFVDDNATECPTATYTDIQAAIDSEPDGTVIIICGGTYPEFGMDARSKLTLSGGAFGDVFVNLGNTLGEGAIISVSNSTNIVIEGLHVNGNDNFEVDVADRFIGGIGFWDSSGVIRNNEVYGIWPNMASSEGGSANGVGIWLHGVTIDGVFPRTLVEGNHVYDFQNTGIGAREEANVTVEGNHIEGEDSGWGFWQTGVSFSAGALGAIVDNEIYDVDEGNGIDLNQVSGLKVVDNDIVGADTGIWVYDQCGDGTTPSDANKITGNDLYEIENTGIGLMAATNAGSACDPSVSGNKIQGNFIESASPGSGTGILIRAEDQDGSGTGFDAPLADANKVKGNYIVGFWNLVEDAGSNTKTSANTYIVP